MKTDILVIGGGIAGLSFALRVSKRASVTLVTKTEVMESNTRYAQGGLAGVFSENDDFALHVADTLKVGDGICNKEAVKVLVENAPDSITWLDSLGVAFDKNGSFHLGKEAVHSRRRIVHAGDSTGKSIQQVLVDRVTEGKITVLEQHDVVSILSEKGRCGGAVVVCDGERKIIHARATVLATGGIGNLYSRTCNPAIATGDGIALAYEAGATLMDMEFIQFHPTGLLHKGTNFLLTERLRGEGALLVNAQGERFMEHYHPEREMAARDIVARACFMEAQKTGADVYLDMTTIAKDVLEKEFPAITAKCTLLGYDVFSEPVPVSPTAHYLCGGVKIDLSGRTDVDGLYAIGEVSCSGAHGADRLASNSLVDGLVFSKRLAEHLEKGLLEPVEIEETLLDEESSSLSAIQALMWEHVGIVRNQQGLQYCLDELKKLTGRNATVAEMITRCALAREESRGTHYRSDFSTKIDLFRKHTLINKEGISFE
ncbi:MAG: L-aspartate oxidase [Nanoarchaeota archaeon]|nr:L-aspartate oxidase [Nanoarchaeota archaeon]